MPLFNCLCSAHISRFPNFIHALFNLMSFILQHLVKKTMKKGLSFLLLSLSSLHYTPALTAERLISSSFMFLCYFAFVYLQELSHSALCSSLFFFLLHFPTRLSGSWKNKTSYSSLIHVMKNKIIIISWIGRHKHSHQQTQHCFVAMSLL